MIPTTTSVAAVVPTFNRKALLVECLQALFSQTRPPEHVFVVDNASTDGTVDELELLGFANDPRVTILRLASNVGGAGGFREGVERAHRAGYSWVWLMDDDAEPTPSCLEMLLRHATPAVGALCPKIVGADGAVQDYHHKVISPFGFERAANLTGGAGETVRVDANAFVGPLVSAAALDLVGYPEPGLFLQGDDTEFTWRLSKRLPVAVVPSAIIRHKDRQPPAGTPAAAWRTYYMVRNVTWIRRRHGRPLQNFSSLYLVSRWVLTRPGGIRFRAGVLRAFAKGFRSKVVAEWRPS